MKRCGAWLIVSISFLALMAAWNYDPAPGIIGPPNDAIENATEVENLPFSEDIDMDAASREATDPACGGSVGTVWYRFMPAEDVRIVIRAFGPWGAANPVLGVYRGTPDNLETIACQGFPDAWVEVAAEAGETYYMMVASVFDPTFSIEVVQPRPGDTIENATVIENVPFSGLFDVTGATADRDDPACGADGPTVWYRFTPARDMRIEARAASGGPFGAEPDPFLGVYRHRRGTPGALEPIACVGGDEPPYTAVFQATAGQTYYFMVRSPGDLVRFSLAVP